MNDLIYRQEAIDAVLKEKVDEDESFLESPFECNSMIDCAVEVLENLPSAQPFATDINVGDMISRQAAIKTFKNLQDCYNGFSDTYDKACIIGVLEEEPSVQATPCDFCVHNNDCEDARIYCPAMPKEGKRGIKMDDLISRKAVLALPTNKVRIFFGEVIGETISVSEIENLPSVKGREIIRCGECEHYVKTGKFCSYDGRIQKNSRHVYGILCDENWFCADGKRKTDGAKMGGDEP